MGQEKKGQAQGRRARTAALLVGDQVRSPGGPAPRLHHSTGLSPPDPRLHQAGGPPKEAKSVQSPPCFLQRYGHPTRPQRQPSSSPLGHSQAHPLFPGGCCPLQASCGPGPISQHSICRTQEALRKCPTPLHPLLPQWRPSGYLRAQSSVLGHEAR